MTSAAASLLASAKAPQPVIPVNFDVPAHACDCHTHILGDPRKFRFSPDRRYTPETALPVEMAALHRTLHMERVVIVTPSVYGTDNSATLYGMKARGSSARGIAVIDERTTSRDLDAMGNAGIRGIRLNLATSGINDPRAARERFQSAVARMKSRGWHIQIYTNLAVVAAIKELVLDSSVPIVFDHFGGAEASRGLAQPGFPDLIELVKSGKAYVKVSGANRASVMGPAYSDVAPLAKALIAANPERVLWGTDWPHTGSAPSVEQALGPVIPFLPIDDARLLNELALWCPAQATLKKVLVDNPAKLYDFQA